ncbi:MBT domain-containing 1-like isoform X2, partial [Paramuricea clavata]
MSCLKDVHIGMKVEVINNGVESFNNSENTTFWVASVIKFKHFKTLLRYEGYDEGDNADFWFDLRCRDIHPVGWCARINKPLIPPQEIKTRINDWQEYLFQRLSGAKTFSAEFLQKVQEIPHNRFKVGMKVEVADRKNLYSVMCVATVVDVVGDRLRLRYDGLDPEVAEDFWCHYYSTDIHPVGWSSLVGHQLRPPIGWKNSISEWNKLIEKILAQDRDAPQEIFSE